MVDINKPRHREIFIQCGDLLLAVAIFYKETRECVLDVVPLDITTVVVGDRRGVEMTSGEGTQGQFRCPHRRRNQMKNKRGNNEGEGQNEGNNEHQVGVGSHEDMQNVVDEEDNDMESYN